MQIAVEAKHPAPPRYKSKNARNQNVISLVNFEAISETVGFVFSPGFGIALGSVIWVR